MTNRPRVINRRILDPACAWGRPLRCINYTIRHSIHQTLIVSSGKYLALGPRQGLDRAVSQRSYIRA
jgi:hypothetical protein